MTLLSTHNLAKNFDSLNVIRDISLDLKAGEIVCLLGASGSGKTTLLEILAGLQKPDSGTISSHINRPGPQLGYMTQNDPLIPWLSARDNVALGPELLGRDKAAARNIADILLQQVGLVAFADTKPAALSGGMQQRVLLARTLATAPKLLLLDEPMSKLDVLARREMAEIVKNYVHEQQAAALVVTHSVEEACTLSDRILLITRSPAVIHAEIVAGHESMDKVMAALMQTLEGQAA
jgi:ABC-type nitrate/sulfonate/bicarbonate transport system ATPase subunit